MCQIPDLDQLCNNVIGDVITPTIDSSARIQDPQVFSLNIEEGEAAAAPAVVPAPSGAPTPSAAPAPSAAPKAPMPGQLPRRLATEQRRPVPQSSGLQWKP